MSKRKRVVIMSTALLPFVALSCWLISAEQAIAGVVVFCAVIVFGNWFTYHSIFRNAKKATEVKR